MTKRWCSPEVADQQSRGRPSDVFSLGCVFSEMYTTLVCQSRDEFQRHREEDDGIDAFHRKLPRVKQWLYELDSKIDEYDRQHEPYYNLSGGSKPNAFIDLLIEMIDKDPSLRPTSSDLLSRLNAVEIRGLGTNYTRHQGPCCSVPVEPYRVAEEDEIFEAFKFNERIDSIVRLDLLYKV